jgi:predicted O-methyltransferase YrrM
MESRINRKSKENMKTLDYIKKKYNLKLDRQVIQIDGMNREDLAKLFSELKFKKGAEIGTLRGDYAEVLCRNIENLHLYCVDPYMAYQVYVRWHTQKELDEAYRIAQDKVKNYNVTFIKDMSINGARYIDDKTIDFVYIDASHSYRDVVDDIDTWYKKVRSGGIISGHDYLRRKSPSNTHIIQAVNGFVDSYCIKPYFITDRPDELKGKDRDMARSWFFVKP